METTEKTTEAAAETDATTEAPATAAEPAEEPAAETRPGGLVRAVLGVMGDVRGIEKTMSVGYGQGSYKGVSDRDVKLAVGRAMQRHGLAIMTLSIEPSVRVDRWEEGGRARQQVFTEVRARYLLVHEGGESMEIAGYGQGVDAQDKGAGKAMTYALKNALLYAFLVPTGAIEDTDAKHSDSYPVPGGVPPGLPAAVNGCADRDSLSAVWRNNAALHANGGFVRMVGLRYIALAATPAEVEKVFEWRPSLRADERCAAAAEKRRRELAEAA